MACMKERNTEHDAAEGKAGNQQDCIHYLSVAGKKDPPLELSRRSIQGLGGWLCKL